MWLGIIQSFEGLNRRKKQRKGNSLSLLKLKQPFSGSNSLEEELFRRRAQGQHTLSIHGGQEDKHGDK